MDSGGVVQTLAEWKKKHRGKALWWIVTGAALCLLYPKPAGFEKSPDTVARKRRALTPVEISEMVQKLIIRYTDDVLLRAPVSFTNATTLQFTETPKHLETDEFYRDHFETLDPQIARLYGDRWDYHEKVVASAVGRWNNEHLTIGSLAYFGRAPRESDVRNEFANQVLRMRVDKALRGFMESPNRPAEFRSAGAALEKMKNVSIPLAAPTAKGGPAPEVRVGYDPTSDNSKIEYDSANFKGGIYYPGIMASLSGGPVSTPVMSMQTILGAGLPSASFTYRLGVAQVEAGISQPLSSVWIATVNSRFALRREDPSGYAHSFSLSYSF